MLDFWHQIVAVFVGLVFLGQAFTIMLVYVWSRRNPYVRMNFFGLFSFQAPYLPWVLLGFSLLLGNSVIVDLMGWCAVFLWLLNSLHILTISLVTGQAYCALESCRITAPHFLSECHKR